MSSLSTAPVLTGDLSALPDIDVLSRSALGGQDAVLSAAPPATAVDAGAAAVPVDAGVTATSVFRRGMELLREGAQIQDLLQVLQTEVGLLGIKIAVPVLKGIWRDPEQWQDSVQDGVRKEMISLVTGPIDLFLAVAEFTGRATACIVFRAGLGWAEIQSADVIGPGVLIDAERDLCKPYEEFQQQLARLEALGDEMFTTLGEMLRHPLDATLEVLELAVLVFAELNDLMDQDSPLRTRVLKVLQDPKQSGEFTGRLLFNVLLLFVPGAEEADAAAQVGRGLSLAARQAEAEAKLARLGMTAAEDTELPAEFLELLEEVRAAMRKSRLRMSESVKDKKFQVVRKVSQLSDLTEALLLMSRERIYTTLVQKRGTVGAIRDLAAVVDDFNAHSKLVFLLELERQGATSVAAGDVALGGMTQAEQLLDRAHLVDARFFDQFSADARAALGWTSDADMPGVIATAAEHRRSWPSYFTKLDSSGGALPADLQELQSVTPYFRQRIIKADATGAAIPGELTPVTGATFLRPDAKASAIVEAHLKVWQDARYSMAGGLASKGVIPELQRILALLLAKGL